MNLLEQQLRAGTAASRQRARELLRSRGAKLHTLIANLGLMVFDESESAAADGAGRASQRPRWMTTSELLTSMGFPVRSEHCAVMNGTKCQFSDGEAQLLTWRTPSALVAVCHRKISFVASLPPAACL